MGDDSLTLHYRISNKNKVIFLLENEEKNSSLSSPCGPHGVFRQINNNIICSCEPDFIGKPPYCRPQCILSNECPFDLACENNKCIDPCRNSCGVNADCLVINHSPICTCKADYTGNPFTVCMKNQSKSIFTWIL